MPSKRIYVGNLPENVTNEEVSSKFSHFGSIENVEVKSKNDTTFAFISLNVESEYQAQECINVLNNTKWKGSLMKVQLAKESFMERLKREQEENKSRFGNNSGTSNNTTFDPPAKKSKIDAMVEESLNQKSERSKESVKKTKKIQAKNDSDSSDTSDDDEDDRPLPAFKGLMAYPELQANAADHQEVISVGVQNQEVKSNGIKLSQQVSDEPEILEIQPNNKLQEKLLKIASTAGRRPEKYQLQQQTKAPIAPVPPPVKTVKVPASVKWNVSKEAEPPVYDNLQNKLLSIASIGDPEAPKPQASKWNQNKNTAEVSETRQGPLNFRKRDSDAVRQKSLEARLNLNQTRSSIIKSTIQSSLSQVQAAGSQPKEPSKLSAALFGDDDGADEDNAFKIRPQFEGKSGEKNLELSSKFASVDKRFAFDERFREEDDEEGDNQADGQEKEKMFSILSDVLGSTVAPKIKPKDTLNKSIIIQRYDPENDSVPIPPARPTEKASGESKNKIPDSQVAQETTEVPAEAVYHVAPNLKDLFTSSTTTSSFSLLGAFGTEPEEDQTVRNNNNNASSKSSGQNFWEGKKFKYDSSDSENEDEELQPSEQLEKIKVRSTDRFFFKKNDKRFQGVQDYFLNNDENMDDVVYRFNNGERMELKLICKSKIKNTKRKSDRRMETLRRLKRKARSKRKAKYAPQGSNAVPIGKGKKAK